ncbi:hypothetical protein C8J57DRAFT_1600093 [Mycena rebaudengoi]|nr:hypothetical protein C8J57DRAFT_1600093 [Mycena rebaudengoi]
MKRSALLFDPALDPERAIGSAETSLIFTTLCAHVPTGVRGIGDSAWNQTLVVSARGQNYSGHAKKIVECTSRFAHNHSSGCNLKFLHERWMLKVGSLLRILRNPQAVMMRIGRELFRESKNAIVEGGAFQNGRMRELLSLLVRANTSKDIPESQRLSDEDVLAQVPTFLVQDMRQRGKPELEKTEENKT